MVPAIQLPIAVLLAAVSLMAGVAGTWSATSGPMSVARYHFAQVVLADGRVLAMGGTDSTSAPLATAEIYNPATGLWTLTGSLATPRSDLAAALLPNGKVLAAGGVAAGNVVLASAEVFDPATGTWSGTGALNAARTQFTVTTLVTGKVLAAAGCPVAPTCNYTNALTSAELYDPASGAWSGTGGMASNRFGHTAIVLDNGSVMVTPLTGTNLIGNPEIYSPSAGTWSLGGTMSYQYPTYAIGVKLYGGKVLMIGGYPRVGAFHIGTELYDAATNAWTAGNNLSYLQVGETATVLTTGEVLLAGGGYTVRSSGRQSFTVWDVSSEMYTPSTGAFSVISPMTSIRYFPVSSPLNDGTVLTSGGTIVSNGVYANSAATEIYTPNTLSISPNSLNLGNALLSQTAAALKSTLTNLTKVPLGISSVVATGDFAQTNNCAPSLPALGTCALTVTFTPTAAGSRTGNVNLTLAGAPFAASLSLAGTGLAEALIPATAAISLATIQNTSATATFTVTNAAPVSVTGTILATGSAFSQTNDCPATFAAGQTCTVKVTFAPPAVGSFTGAVSLAGTGEPPAKVTLTGQGTPVALTVSPLLLNFGTHVPGDNPTLKVQVSNASAVQIGIPGAGIYGSTAFIATNLCPKKLGAGAHCTIYVTFLPKTAVSYTGLLLIDDSLGTVHKVGLEGNGNGN